VKILKNFEPDLVFDASNAVEGRLASVTAKALLEGKNVAIVNADKAIISKPIDGVVKWLQPWYGIHSWINPRKHSPRKYMTVEGYFRTSIRNMLPVDKVRGREAYKRLRVYEGVPKELSSYQFETPKKVMWNGKEGHCTTLLELASYYGRKRVEHV